MDPEAVRDLEAFNGACLELCVKELEELARPPEEAGGSIPGLRPLARSQDPGRPARPEGRAEGPFREGPRRRRGDPESTWPGGTPVGGETEGTWRGTQARPKAGPEGTLGQPGDRSESEA